MHISEEILFVKKKDNNSYFIGIYFRYLCLISFKIGLVNNTFLNL